MKPSFAPGQGPGTLYVFLHGLICLVETSKEYFGLVVDMGDAHSYRAGSWLTELPMPRQSIFSLLGVTPGHAKLDGKKISIIEKPLFPSPSLYATLRLPKPKSIRSLRRTTFPAAVVSGTETGELTETGKGEFTIAALQILEYDFKETSDVAIGDGSFWRSPAVSGEERSVTLHFYAEPESEKPSGHQIDEFKQAVTLFSLFDLALNNALRVRGVEAGEYPPGLKTSEALGLAERRPILAAMAESLRTGEPLVEVSEGGPGGALCAPPAGRG